MIIKWAKKVTNLIFLIAILKIGYCANVIPDNVTELSIRVKHYCPTHCVCPNAVSSLCVNLNASQILTLLDNDSNKFFSTLRNLTIHNSELYNLTPLRALLKRATQLSYLDISYNIINTTIINNDYEVIPSSVVTLNLNHNRFASINREAFFPLFANVEEIYLQGNGIFSIQWEAFRLFRLKRLYLSHNYLATINEHMLRFTPNLEFLDLSHNQLSLAQSSSFFAAQRLVHVDLSFNRIQQLRYDSFSPLFQLEFLNVAFNNLSQIPADLRQFIALRVLNISGNPIEKICANEIDQPVLQILDVSHCSKLRLIEANAFTKLPNLQSAFLLNNTALNFISPLAFQTIKMLYELDLSGNALVTLNESIIELPTRIFLAKNPFDCGCIEPIIRRLAMHVIDRENVTCKRENNTVRIMSSLIDDNKDVCVGGIPLLPLGEKLSANIGDFFSLYCAPRNANDLILWTLPNGTRLLGGNSKNFSILTKQSKEIYGPTIEHPRSFITSAIMHFPHLKESISSPATNNEQLLYASSSQNVKLSTRSYLHFSSLMPGLQLQRVTATQEQIHFEVITEDDEGNYSCHVIPNYVANNIDDIDTIAFSASTEMERIINLKIKRPHIALIVVEMGSHYALLRWNSTLRVRATDKVALSLDVRDAISGQISRSIQLSLFNPWYSYNVMRLRPSNNYTFCLAYRLLDYNTNFMESTGHATFFGAPNGAGAVGAVVQNLQARHLLFETCVSAQTIENLSFWRLLDTSTVITIVTIFFIIIGLAIIRTLYLRFYIWQETKLRARMNESLSGQSFLSNSSAMHVGDFSRSTTFENTFQVLNHCATNGQSFGVRASSCNGCDVTRNTKRNIGGSETSRVLNFDNIAV